MLKTDESVTAQINLYYDLFVPENAKPSAPLLITIHGYAAHKRYMMREAKLIAPDDFIIASLQAPNKFWREAKDGDYKLAFGWLTDYKAEESVALHHKFVLDVIGKLSSDQIVDPKKVFLHGFSQACALNFRFAFTNPDVLRGVIGVCGGIPSDLDSNEIYRPTKADTLYIYGDKDMFYSSEKFVGFEKRLGEYLPSFESKKYSAGHEITNEMRTDTENWLELRSE